MQRYAIFSFVFLLFVCVQRLTSGAIDGDPGCVPDVSLEAKTAQVTNCMQQQVVLQEIAGAFTSAYLTDNWANTMKTYCPKFRAAVDCVNPVQTTEAGKKVCPNPLYRLIMSKVRLALHDIVEYICYDDGRRVLDFISHKGTQCLLNLQQQLQQCAASMSSAFPGRIPGSLDPGMMMPTGIMHPGLGDNMSPGGGGDGKNMMEFMQQYLKTVFVPGETSASCRKLNNVTSCAFTLMKEHCEAQVHDFLHHLYRLVMRWTPCWGILSDLERLQPEHYFLAAFLPGQMLVKDKVCPESGLTPYDLAVQALGNATVCLNAKMDDNLLVEDVRYAVATGKYENVVVKYCPRVLSRLTCFESFLDTFNVSCISDDDKLVLQSTKAIVSHGINYLCADNGEKIREFLKHKGLACLAEQSDALVTCLETKGVQDTLHHRSQSMDVSVLGLSGLWVPQRYDRDECLALAAMDVCVIASLRNCQDKVPAEIVTGALKGASQTTACLKATLAAPPPTSLAGGATVAVAMAAAAIYVNRMP